MKKRIIAEHIALLLALLMLCATPAFAADLPAGAVLLSDSKKIDPNAVKLIAYRGLSACAPANSLAAISLAGRCGCRRSKKSSGFVL